MKAAEADKAYHHHRVMGRMIGQGIGKKIPKRDCPTAGQCIVLGGHLQSSIEGRRFQAIQMLGPRTRNRSQAIRLHKFWGSTQYG